MMNLYKKRGVGEIISDTLVLTREAFVPAGKHVLRYFGVPYILVLIFSTVTLYYTKTLAAGLLEENPFEFLKIVGGGGVLLVVIGGAINIGVVAMIYGFMVLAEEKKSYDITSAEVWAMCQKNYLPLLLNGFLFGLLMSLGFLFLVIPGIYLAVCLAPLLFLAMREDLGFSEAASRCFVLIRGKWWKVFGLFLVIFAILFAIASILSFLSNFGTFANLFSGDFENINDKSTMTIALETLFQFLTTLFNFALQIVSQFLTVILYFTLLEESEGVSLRSRIDEFGA